MQSVYVRQLLPMFSVQERLPPFVLSTQVSAVLLPARRIPSTRDQRPLALTLRTRYSPSDLGRGGTWTSRTSARPHFPVRADSLENSGREEEKEKADLECGQTDENTGCEKAEREEEPEDAPHCPMGVSDCEGWGVKVGGTLRRTASAYLGERRGIGGVYFSCDRVIYPPTALV
jgi:hypothetical protein